MNEDHPQDEAFDGCERLLWCVVAVALVAAVAVVIGIGMAAVVVVPK